MAMQKKHAVDFSKYNACDSILSDIFQENKDVAILYATIVAFHSHYLGQLPTV